MVVLIFQREDVLPSSLQTLTCPAGTTSNPQLRRHFSTTRHFKTLITKLSRSMRPEGIASRGN